MNKNFLQVALYAVLTVLVTTQAALATVLTQMTPGGLAMQWDIALLSFVICTVSGVAALLQRINAELKSNPDHQLPNPVLFCATYMFGSWAAGLAAFILSQQMRFDIWASLGTMMAASYLGARWLEAWAESKLPKPPAAPPAQEQSP